MVRRTTGNALARPHGYCWKGARTNLDHERQQRGPWSSAEQRNLYFYERSLEEIQNAGVPAHSVDVLMNEVGSTHEEAKLVKQYAVEHGLQSVLDCHVGLPLAPRALDVLARVSRHGNSGRSDAGRSGRRLAATRNLVAKRTRLEIGADRVCEDDLLHG